MEKKYCMQCGKEVAMGARFCADCGFAVSGKPPGAPLTPRVDIDLGLNDNAIVFLTYLIPVLAALFVLNTTTYNRKAPLRFHAWQSIFFVGAWFALHLAVVLISLPLAMVGLPLIGVLSPVVHLGLIAAWVYLMVQALMGKTVRLPVVGDYAEQQAAKIPPSAF